MRIKSAKITKLALCPRGMNGLRTLYKADDGTVTVEMLCKASANFAEDGEILAVAWVPDLADNSPTADWAEAAVVKEMLYGFMREGATLNLSHAGKDLTREQAFVAEAFLIQKDDPRFAGWQTYTGQPVDVTGGWGTVIKVDDPAIRKDHREGGWSGVSIEGKAVVDDVPPPIKKDDKMAFTPEDLVQLNKAIADGIKADRVVRETEAAAALAKAAAEKPAAIEFEGDRNKPEDVEKHLAKVKAAKVDWNDPVAVAKHLAELNKGDEDTDGSDEDEAGEEVQVGRSDTDEEETDDGDPIAKEEKRHKARMRELRGRSNAPIAKGKTTRVAKTAADIEKEDRAAIKRCADAENKRLGRFVPVA